jgi:hypothetical protein
MDIDTPIGITANDTVIHIKIVYPAIFRYDDDVLGVFLNVQQYGAAGEVKHGRQKDKHKKRFRNKLFHNKLASLFLVK